MGTYDPLPRNIASRLQTIRNEAEGIILSVNRLLEELRVVREEAQPEKPAPQAQPRDWHCPLCGLDFSWGGHFSHEQHCRGPKPARAPMRREPCAQCGRKLYPSQRPAHDAEHERGRAHALNQTRMEVGVPMLRRSMLGTPQPVKSAPDRTKTCQCGGPIIWDRNGGECQNCHRHIHRWRLGTPHGVTAAVEHTCPCGETRTIHTDPEVNWGGAARNAQ